MKHWRLSIALLLVAAAAATAWRWPRPAVAQETTTETRDVRAFNAIDLEGPGRLVVTVGGAPALRVTALASDLRRIDSEVDGNTLELEFEGRVFNRRPDGPILYEVTVTTLRELDLEGGAEAELSGIDEPRLVLDLSGRSKVTITDLQVSGLEVELSSGSVATLAGAVESQDVELSGTSEYQALALDSRDATVDASGASLARLRVQNTLDAEASSGATIEYIGENVEVRRDIGPSATLTQLPFEPLPQQSAATPTA